VVYRSGFLETNISKYSNYPVLCFVGPGRSGKDEACLWLSKHTPLKYAGGCSLTVLPWVAKQLGISEEEAWATRHQNRDEWFKLCNRYRADDPARIVRESLSHSNIISGIRSNTEFMAAKKEGLFDLSVWVHRATGFDSTIQFGINDADIVIVNEEGLDEYYEKLKRLALALNIPVKE
jgi:hypothetical protein